MMKKMMQDGVQIGCYQETAASNTKIRKAFVNHDINGYKTFFTQHDKSKQVRGMMTVVDETLVANRLPVRNVKSLLAVEIHESATTPKVIIINVYINPALTRAEKNDVYKEMTEIRRNFHHQNVVIVGDFNEKPDTVDHKVVTRINEGRYGRAKLLRSPHFTFTSGTKVRSKIDHAVVALDVVLDSMLTIIQKGAIPHITCDHRALFVQIGDITAVRKNKRIASPPHEIVYPNIPGHMYDWGAVKESIPLLNRVATHRMILNNANTLASDPTWQEIWHEMHNDEATNPQATPQARIDRLYERIVTNAHQLMKKHILPKLANADQRRKRRKACAWKLREHWSAVATLVRTHKIGLRGLNLTDSVHLTTTVKNHLETNYHRVWDEGQYGAINRSLTRIIDLTEKQELKENQAEKGNLQNLLKGKKQSQNPPIRLQTANNLTTTTDKDTAEQFAKHMDAFNQETKRKTDQLEYEGTDGESRTSQLTEGKLQDGRIEEHHVAATIINGKPHASIGSDGVPYSFWKACTYPVTKMLNGRDEGKGTAQHLINRSCEVMDAKYGVKRPKNVHATMFTREPDPNNWLLKCLTRVLNMAYMTKTTPTLWNISHITMLPKGGDASLPENFRPISLMANAQKILHTILNERLNDYLDETQTLDTAQCGYRRKRSRCEQILTILEYVKHRRTYRGEQTWAAFLDIKKAFDGVNHRSLLDGLVNVGITPESPFYQYIEQMYGNLYYCCKVGTSFSTAKKQDVGIKQGCPLSPVLFNIMFDSIISKIITSDDIMEEDEDLTLLLHKVAQGVLAYADDVALLGRNREKLMKMLKKAVDLMGKHGLMVNQKKTKVMVFNGPEIGPENNKVSFTHQGENYSFDVVDDFRYLGFVYNSRITNENHVLNAQYYETIPIKRTKYQFEYLLTNRELPIPFKADVIRSDVYPILLHNAPVLGVLYHHNKEMFTKKVANPINKMLRKIMLNSSRKANTGTTTLGNYVAMNITMPDVYVRVQAFNWVCSIFQHERNQTLIALMHQGHLDQPYVGAPGSRSAHIRTNANWLESARQNAQQFNHSESGSSPHGQLTRSFIAEMKKLLCEARVMNAKGDIVTVNFLPLLPSKLHEYMQKYAPEVVEPLSMVGKRVIHVKKWETIVREGLFTRDCRQFDLNVKFEQRCAEVVTQLLYNTHERANANKETFINFGKNGGAKTMKRINQCARLTPDFNRGWDALRTFVMDGHRPMESISDRERIECESCPGKLMDAEHVLLKCPKFEAIRAEAFEKTHQILTKEGLTQKLQHTMASVRKVNDNDVLERLKADLDAADVDAELYDAPMSVKAMAIREAYGMTNVNKLLRSEYHISGKRREVLLKKNRVLDEQVQRLTSEDYIKYVKLKEFATKNANLDQLDKATNWTAESLGKLFPRIHDALNVSSAGFIEACWRTTFMASFFTISDSIWR